MEKTVGQHVPWWKITANVFWGGLGLVGTVLTLAPLWSSAARDWYSANGVLGWIIVGALAFIGSIAFALQRERHRRQLADLEPKIKARLEAAANRRPEECTSDIAVVQRRLGPFMSDGNLRMKLCTLPSEKYFSRELGSGFSRLERDLDDKSKVVFDADLRIALEELRTALNAYWRPLDDVLDAPDKAENSPWDWRVVEPPNGPWTGATEDDQKNNYYAFIRSLAPLRHAFLEKVDLVEAQLHRLRVESEPLPRP